MIRRALTIAALVPTLTLAACTQPAEPPAPVGASGTPTADSGRAVVLPFDAYFDVAEFGQSADEIPVAQSLSETVFTSGWNVISPEGSAAPSAWTTAGPAVIDLSLVMPRDRTLTLSLTPPPFPDEGEPRAVTIAWNETDLGTHVVSEAGVTLAIPVPASAQRSGPNRIALTPTEPVGLGEQTIGVQLTGLALSDAAATGAVARDRFTIVQEPDSVFTLYFAIPDGGVLSGELTARDAESATGTLNILTDSGKETISWNASPDASGVRVDLTQWAGKHAGFSFSNPPESGGAVEWNRLRLAGTEPDPKPEGVVRDRYNVLIVLFDTLRADHTEPYGGTVATPRLTALAEEGVTFIRSYSPMPWTRGAVTSLFTSLYPSRHGLKLSNQSLGPTPALLPEMLQQAGYDTLAVFANPTVSREFGFARGFNRDHEIFREEIAGQIMALQTPEERADFVWENYLASVVHNDETPFFVFLHEIDPHGPWTPPAPYDMLYTNERRQDYNVTPELIHGIRSGDVTLAPEDRDYLHALYKAEVTFMDTYLERILTRLAGSGRYEDTLVVFLSDHGEEFLEHGLLTHGHSLYEELLHVPILFRLPNVVAKGARSDTPAELTDIAPTIFDLVGIDRHPAMQGESLLPWLVDAEAPARERPVYGSMGTRWHPLSWDSARLGNWKAIQHMVDPYRSAQRGWQLFGLEEDPGEKINRWAEQLVPGKTVRQLVLWRRHFDSMGGTLGAVDHQPEAIDPEIEENLEALGYVN